MTEKDQHARVAGEYEAVHIHWTDTLCFCTDGTCYRQANGDRARFDFPSQGIVRIDWFDWDPEQLMLDGSDYVGTHLKLVRKSGASLEQMQRNRNEGTGPLYVQFGASWNHLPGWFNVDLPRFDITKALLWENDSVDAFFLEHVIEHVSPASAHGFFEEAFRSLKPGGILRLAYPDVVRIWHRADESYRDFLRTSGYGDGSVSCPVKSIIRNHGHQAVWSRDTMRAVLESIGFEVEDARPGESRRPHLRDLERHGNSIGVHNNDIETSCIEAMKPLSLQRHE